MQNTTPQAQPYAKPFAKPYCGAHYWRIITGKNMRLNVCIPLSPARASYVLTDWNHRLEAETGDVDQKEIPALIARLFDHVETDALRRGDTQLLTRYDQSGLPLSVRVSVSAGGAARADLIPIHSRIKEQTMRQTFLEKVCFANA